MFREDVVEVDTWVAASGKNGMRRDWHVRDYRTGQTVMRATRFDKFIIIDLMLCASLVIHSFCFELYLEACG